MCVLKFIRIADSLFVLNKNKNQFSGNWQSGNEKHFCLLLTGDRALPRRDTGFQQTFINESSYILFLFMLQFHGYSLILTVLQSFILVARKWEISRFLPKKRFSAAPLEKLLIRQSKSPELNLQTFLPDLQSSIEYASTPLKFISIEYASTPLKFISIIVVCNLRPRFARRPVPHLIKPGDITKEF